MLIVHVPHSSRTLFLAVLQLSLHLTSHMSSTRPVLALEALRRTTIWLLTLAAPILLSGKTQLVIPTD
jgi:hypothetical protein